MNKLNNNNLKLKKNINNNLIDIINNFDKGKILYEDMMNLIYKFVFRFEFIEKRESVIYNNAMEYYFHSISKHSPFWDKHLGENKNDLSSVLTWEGFFIGPTFHNTNIDDCGLCHPMVLPDLSESSDCGELELMLDQLRLQLESENN